MNCKMMVKKSMLHILRNKLLLKIQDENIRLRELYLERKKTLPYCINCDK